jgi:hypothetical protein
MSESILIFRGFARRASWCHVVVATDDQGATAVLVGELDDNPGTTVTNALEQVAATITSRLLDGDRHFDLYEYVPIGLPELKPTFYRIEWRGEPGEFSMPTWQTIDPKDDRWLRHIHDRVRPHEYTSQALIAERQLRIIDGRDQENLPSES